MALMKQKRYSEAHEKFVEASRLNKYNFMAMLLAAIMEIRLERYEDAELKLNFLSTVAPNESNTYEYAHLKYIKKDYSGAEYYAKKALEFNPLMLNPSLLLGKIYREQLDIKKAEDVFNAALVHHASKPDLYYEWGVMYQYFEKYIEAKAMFEKVLEISPEEAFAKAGLGLTLAALGDIENAEKFVYDELEKEPECYLAIKGKAFILFYKEECENAIEVFKQILKEDSTDVVCNFYIAKCYEKLGNDILTKEYYENAINKFPSHVNSYINYSEYLIKRGEFAEAQRKLRRALKVDDNNLQILNLLFYVSYILVKENVCEYNIKEALAIAEKVCSIDLNSFEYNGEKAELSTILENL